MGVSVLHFWENGERFRHRNTQPPGRTIYPGGYVWGTEFVPPAETFEEKEFLSLVDNFERTEFLSLAEKFEGKEFLSLAKKFEGKEFLSLAGRFQGTEYLSLVENFEGTEFLSLAGKFEGTEFLSLVEILKKQNCCPLRRGFKGQVCPWRICLGDRICTPSGDV